MFRGMTSFIPSTKIRSFSMVLFYSLTFKILFIVNLHLSFIFRSSFVLFHLFFVLFHLFFMFFSLLIIVIDSSRIGNYTQQPMRYWTAKNMRSFLENFAKSKGWDPLLPQTWYATRIDMIRKQKVPFYSYYYYL